jgi:hypothetical protein
MAPTTHRARSSQAWRLAHRQYGVLARRQLLAIGFSPDAIKHRLRTGRLHRVRRGIYTVSGGLAPSREARWMATLLACGDGAFLTHLSAGSLYGVCEERPERIEVGVRHAHPIRQQDLRIRRRARVAREELGTLRGIPVTSPVQTMIDLATVQGPKTLLRSINEADARDVVDPERLRRALEDRPGEPGVPLLRSLLDRNTFVLSDEELERLFLPLALESGLSLPLTKEIVNGFEVDFYWPALKLVVETDGLRYHRTPSAQARDLRRDQAHTAAGYARLRFSHWQVAYEQDHVKRILTDTRRGLGVP